MSDVVTASIITGVATLIASFGGTNLFKYFKNYKKRGIWDFLLGTWEGKWIYEDGKILDDVIHLKKIKGNKIIGKGDGPLGPYDIWGEITLTSVLLTFKGEKSQFDYAGVCLSSSRMGNRTNMEGKWLQFSEDKRIISGKVNLKKRLS